MKRDKAVWASLPILALQWRFGELVEMRNCRCGSTLEILIDPTAKAIADVVLQDARPAVHFAMPAGDVTALRDELEERYALWSQAADCWDEDDHRRVSRLVVARTELACADKADDLTRSCRESESEWDEYVTFGRESALGRRTAEENRCARATAEIEGDR